MSRRMSSREMSCDASHRRVSRDRSRTASLEEDCDVLSLASAEIHSEMHALSGACSDLYSIDCESRCSESPASLARFEYRTSSCLSLSRPAPGKSLSKKMATAVASAARAASDLSDKFLWSRGKAKGKAKGKEKVMSAPQVLPPTASLALPNGASRYEGMVAHPLFGPKPVQLTLVVLQQLSPREYEGEWAAMGQIEKVKITISGGSITVHNTSGDECTTLHGEVDSVNGDFRGSCSQGDDSSGSFHLSPVMPCYHRAEILDTDGDNLVFLRSTSGASLAEYCNGELVEAVVTSLKVDSKTRTFSDPSGSFQLGPADFDEVMRKLSMILSSVSGKLVSC